MPNYIVSPNMSLLVPGIGTDPAPDWASNLNTSLSLIDAHDHSLGNGVQITPAGMNITTDLSFQENNAIGLRSVRFIAQSSIIGGVQDLGCMSVSGVDLYYNDENGNQIRITQSGALAGTPGSISGLVSPATATYVPLSSTFIWQSDANTPAIMDMGPIIVRKLATSGHGITIEPNSSIGADYTLTLPASPGSTDNELLLMDASGNVSTLDMGAAALPLTVNSGGTSLGYAQLTAGGLGTAAVTTTKISDGNVTLAKLASPNFVQGSDSTHSFTGTSTSYANITNISGVTFSSSGRPVMVILSSLSSSPAGMGMSNVNSPFGGNLRLSRDGNVVASWVVPNINTANDYQSPTIVYIDQPSAGSHGYSFQYQVLTSGNTFVMSNYTISLYEF